MAPVTLAQSGGGLFQQAVGGPRLQRKALAIRVHRWCIVSAAQSSTV
jgi:hypothetical protein